MAAVLECKRAYRFGLIVEIKKPIGADGDSRAVADHLVRVGGLAIFDCGRVGAANPIADDQWAGNRIERVENDRALIHSRGTSE